MPPKKKKTDNSARLELKRALEKGGLKNLYVFYGEEAFLRDSYLHKLRQTILPDGLESFNLHAARGKDCSIDWIEQAVDCLPMMSERTLVEVTDFDLFFQGEKGRDRLMGILGALPEYCTLVFVYDLLAYKAPGQSKLAALVRDTGSIVNFSRQEEDTLVNWICGQFRRIGKSIDTMDASYLIFLCGDLMHDLSAQIGKIAAYASHPRVTREDIDAVAIPQVSAKAYQMTDALAVKNFDKAASILADLLHAQESPVGILAAMGRYFRQLYTARLFLDRDGSKSRADFEALWGMTSPYTRRQAGQLLDAAKGFSLSWCRYAVRRCAESDAAVKSAPKGAEGDVLTALLVELASGRRVAL